MGSLDLKTAFDFFFLDLVNKFSFELEYCISFGTKKDHLFMSIES